MGESGDHEGFRNGKNKVLGFAKEYVAKNGIKGDIKVWTAGYSRGAGVTNQVAANLIADPTGALGSGVSLAPNNIYCYTFGTPNSASDPDAEWGAYNDPKFNYIHNTWEPYDIVTAAPPQSLGFNRYGTNTGYASGDRKTHKKAAGYKVCIARNKAMTKGLKVITVKGKNKKSHTIRNLKKGTRYYVEVRAIWKKGKTEYTGSSATKTARVR